MFPGMNLVDSQKQRITQLNEFDKIHEEFIQQTTLIQHHRRKWHDKIIRKKQFKLGDGIYLFTLNSYI